jgi:peptide/nickel transport system permease protein
MRVCDVLLVLPGLPLLIVLVAVLGTSIDNLIILLGALGWMGFARVVRSQVISLRERPFIEAAKAVGAGKTHIMFRHILPNVMSLVYVTLATTVPGNIVAEASLGFLGFTDPNRMSWGLMLNNMASNTAYQNWWWVLPPGLCIAFIAIAFILFGYALDEVLNPRLRLRR